MMVWYGHSMTSWGWFVMSLSTLLFWALVVGVGVLLFRTLTRPVLPGHGTWQKTLQGSDPERILAERYARGEIDDEEYHRRLATLRGSPTDTARPSVP